MNKVLLIGRLVNDFEIQETTNGVRFVRFRVAVKRPYNTNEVDFIQIIAWRSQAEFIDKYLKKGTMISVEGRLTASTYNNNEGKKVTRYEVTADRVQGLESKAHMQTREISKTQDFEIENTSTSNISFEEDVQNQTNGINDDVPWDVDL